MRLVLIYLIDSWQRLKYIWIFRREKSFFQINKKTGSS